jgi:hypothetical protein
LIWPKKRERFRLGLNKYPLNTICKEEDDGWDISVNILRSILTAFSNFQTMRCSNLKFVQKILDSDKLTIIVENASYIA